ncbi:MAG: hypothetical protein HY907_04850 [Deltaproteobacteria bacterium]|nr:hypothetical protein [Deltaproteobacteria bacterium]
MTSGRAWNNLRLVRDRALAIIDAAGRPVQVLVDRWAGWCEADPARGRRAAVAFHAAALAALALCAVAWGWSVWSVYGGATVDDAGITYAYAHNVAAGDGFRMTPGEAPTEGFSNPLQVLLLVPVALVANDLDAASKALNIGLLAAALGLLCAFVYAHLRLVARLFAVVPLLLAGYWCGFACWTASGLEGGLLAALQILSLLGVWYGPRRRAADVGLGVAAGLLAWVRPEGFVYGAMAVASRGLRGAVRFGRGGDPAAGEPIRRRLLAAAIYVGLAAALFVFRWAVFRDLVPNAYWAKVPSASTWWSLGDFDGKGWTYVGDFFAARWWYFALPVWAFAVAWRRAAAVTAAAVGQLGFAVLFPAWTGGDWMLEWRFLQPMMGPLAVLCAVGLVGLLGTEPRPARNVARCVLAAGALGLAVVAGLVPGDWSAQRAAIAGRRDIDLRRVRERAVGYRRLSAMLHLGRRMLVAEVDVGGVSYRSGLDVLDIGGLGDRALALARTSRPAVAPDYLYGERRPDVIHLQASWLFATPYQALGPFPGMYRILARGFMDRLGILPLTAVRADLLDPVAPPAVRLGHSLPTAEVTGVTAIASGADRIVVLHARQRGGHDAPPPTWVDAGGARHGALWHGGVTLALPGERGSVLVAVAVIPGSAPLPLVLEGTPIRLERWPDAPAGDGTVEALARVPLLRVAGRPLPACDPDRVLDPAAGPVARARGAGLVARLCGGLRGGTAERWRARATAAAEAAAAPDERYEAAAATLAFGVPQRLSTRLLLEQTRSSRTPFDEVLDAWAREDFAAALDGPERAARGLRMLLAARRFDEVVLQGLAWGPGLPGVAESVCAAARMLGLRSDAVAPRLDCSRIAGVAPPRVLRQGFEDAADPLLRVEGDGGDAWRPAARQRAGTRQRPVIGGQGRLLLNTFDGATGDEATGSVVWGPFPWPGRRFGALLGGGHDGDRVGIAVEGLSGGEWRVLAFLAPRERLEILRPRLVDLGGVRADQVRVRVVDGSRADWGHVLADGLTFLGD